MAATFGTSNFFTSVEPLVNSGERMHVGQDGDIHFVVLDAAFYAMSIFERPINSSFTGGANQTLTADDYVLINGQFFAHARSQYCMTGPCDCKWEGETIVKGLKKTGIPPSRPDFSFFGREASTAIWRYHLGAGDPSGSQPALWNAIGALIPLIEKKIRYGKGDIRSGTTVIQKNNVRVANILSLDPREGKTVIGVHQNSGLIIVVSQEDDAATGIGWQQLINKMAIMGLDDAVYCDGSSSSALCVKNQFLVEPTNLVKNWSIPIGIIFRRTPLNLKTFQVTSVSAVSDSIVTSGSSILPSSTHIYGMKAMIQPRSGQGLKMTISDFGHTSTLVSSGIAGELKAGSQPYEFVSTAGNMSVPVTFLPAQGNSPLNFILQMQKTAGSAFDTVQGTFSTTSPVGVHLSGTISLPISY